MHSWIKKLTLVSLTTLLSISMVGCSKTDPKVEQKKFSKFINNEFVDAMESEYLMLDTFIKDPKKYGIDEAKVKVGLGSYPSIKQVRKHAKAAKIAYEKFEEFDRDSLTKVQQDEYDIYAYQNSLALEMASKDYEYYEQLFSTMSGIHMQLPTLFADWEIENEGDVFDLIVCIRDSKPYIDAAIQYSKEQEQKGLFMADVNGVIEYCQKIVDKGANSSILTSINTQIDQLQSSNAASLKEQVKNAFVEAFIPAYQDIIKFMKNITIAGSINREGYAKFKNGKAYYELLVQSKIGSRKSVEDIRTMMEEAYNKYVLKMTKVIMDHPNDVEALVSQDLPKTEYKSYKEILDRLKEFIKNEYPTVKNLNYNIVDMNKEIASDGISAYFVVPNLDKDSLKQMRVNPTANDVTSISTFSTIAHEGFPGHMYQYAYMYENVKSNYIKAMADVIGYTEGYAVYAQMNSLKYLKNKKISDALLEVYRLNELATYSIIILADIGIHYDGWTLEEFTKYLQEHGFNITGKDAEKQYLQLQANPGAFMPYYVGYAEFEDLRSYAKEQLADKFDVKKFNQAILESGTAPFDVVKRHVDAYIEKNK